MIKCSYYKCLKKLSAEKKEVYAVRLFRTIKIKNGKIINILDGHRWACKEHYNLVKERKIEANLSFVFGPSKKKLYRRKIMFFKKKK